jgi:hypothetical protein
MSRKGSKIEAGRQDGDNFTRGMVTLSPDGAAAPYAPAVPTPVEDPPGGYLTVRTIRQHDTIDGMKMPGDEYQRAYHDAHILAAGNIVEII